MNVLIVFAHPEPASFTAHLKDLAVSRLCDQGHTVVVSDLYAMGFEAAASRDDFRDLQDDAQVNFQMEQRHAARTDGFVAEIAVEQEKILQSDLVILQFPLWWFSMPAIMRGWVDRVLAWGFAYGDGRWYSNGPFTGKRALLAITIGGRQTQYEPTGLNGDIERILWPIHNGILAFTGFSVLPPFLGYGLTRSTEAHRQAIIDAYARYIDGLAALEPLYFHPLSDYGEDRRLKAGVVPHTPGQWQP